MVTEEYVDSEQRGALPNDCWLPLPESPADAPTKRKSDMAPFLQALKDWVRFARCDAWPPQQLPVLIP